MSKDKDKFINHIAIARNGKDIEKARLVVRLTKAGWGTKDLTRLFNCERHKIIILKSLLKLPLSAIGALERDESFTKHHGAVLYRSIRKFPELDAAYWVDRVEKTSLNASLMETLIRAKHNGKHGILFTLDGRGISKSIRLSKNGKRKLWIEMAKLGKDLTKGLNQ